MITAFAIRVSAVTTTMPMLQCQINIQRPEKVSSTLGQWATWRGFRGVIFVVGVPGMQPNRVIVYPTKHMSPDDIRRALVALNTGRTTPYKIQQFAALTLQ